MAEWKKIFSSDNLLQVKLAEDVLKQNDIVSNIIDKHDSTNLTHSAGYVLYAREEDAEKAMASAFVIRFSNRLNSLSDGKGLLIYFHHGKSRFPISHGHL